jgi:hypothetical protein
LNVGGRLHARYQQAFDVGQQSSRQTVTVREVDLGDDQTMGLRGLVDVCGGNLIMSELLEENG